MHPELARVPIFREHVHGKHLLLSFWILCSSLQFLELCRLLIPFPVEVLQCC